MLIREILFLALRTVHVISGVFWVGAAFVITGFVKPTARRLQGEGQRFFQALLVQSQLRRWIMIAAWTAVLSGVVLYGRDWRSGWLVTRSGAALMVGGLAAIAALAIGMCVLRVTADRMAALGKEIQNTTGSPSEAQRQQMNALQQKMDRAGRVEAALFIVVLIGMAVGA